VQEQSTVRVCTHASAPPGAQPAPSHCAPATVALSRGEGGGGQGGSNAIHCLVYRVCAQSASLRLAANGRAAPRADIRGGPALADGLGLRAFFVVGVSGGGPYALAAAAYLPPGRVRGVLTISSPAPAGAARPPARRGSGPGRRPGRAPRVTGAGAPPLQRLPAPQRRGPAMQGARHAGGR